MSSFTNKLVIVLVLTCVLPLSLLAGRRHSIADIKLPGDVSEEVNISDEWVVAGSESDAITKTGFRRGREDEAVFRDSILEGGDSKAVFVNELPLGAIVVDPGDLIATKGDLSGERIVPDKGQLNPGGIESGLYDGTKETDRYVWALEDFNARGGRKFRFIGENVFAAHVEVLTHKEPKWKWGSLTTEKVQLEVKWHKVQTGEKVVKHRVGRKTVRKLTDDHEIVRKMWSEDGETPSMMNVRCLVYERVLVAEYQRYKVPEYKWEKTKVGTYKKKSLLAWVKRYRTVKRKHVLWKYWGSFDDFISQYPNREIYAGRSRRVTERVFAERRMLLRYVPVDDLSSFMSEEKPAGDPKMEFLLSEKRKSITAGVQQFVEHNVPSAEIVSMSKKMLAQ